MKLKSMKIGGFLAFCLFGLTQMIQAEDKELEKRQTKAIEQFMISGRKSDGNYSTISLKNWRNEIGVPFLSNEDMVRKVLNAFEEHYKNLQVVSYSIVYINKSGPSGGLEYDFLLIHHELKPKKVYKFGTKEAEGP